MTLQIFLFRITIAAAAFGLGAGVNFLVQSLPHAAPTPTSLAELKPPSIRDNTVKKAEVEPNELTSEPEAPEEFDPSGDLYIDGKVPKAFKDIDLISIAANEYKLNSAQQWERQSIAPSGSLWTKIEYKFSNISVDEKRISFTTESVRGISYTFKGKFVPIEDGMIIKGHLIKMLNGKKTAEGNFSLLYSECC